MKTNNQLLKEINENTGGNTPAKHKTDNYYLKHIVENTKKGTIDDDVLIQLESDLKDYVDEKIGTMDDWLTS